MIRCAIKIFHCHFTVAHCSIHSCNYPVVLHNGLLLQHSDSLSQPNGHYYNYTLSLHDNSLPHHDAPLSYCNDLPYLNNAFLSYFLSQCSVVAQQCFIIPSQWLYFSVSSHHVQLAHHTSLLSITIVLCPTHRFLLCNVDPLCHNHDSLAQHFV